MNPRCFSRKRETVDIYFQEGKEFVIENNILKGTADPSPETRYTSLGEVILNNMNNDPEFVGQVNELFLLFLLKKLRAIASTVINIQFT